MRRGSISRLHMCEVHGPWTKFSVSQERSLCRRPATPRRTPPAAPTTLVRPERSARDSRFLSFLYPSHRFLIIQPFIIMGLGDVHGVPGLLHVYMYLRSSQAVIHTLQDASSRLFRNSLRCRGIILCSFRPLVYISIQHTCND